eukprot:TRINITY_DN581_c0_g1_i2.p1 TRINITY_DN581_c0_g1~~TRINITY_DN581_c0_g1_i2.p1  ORF type:complete len:340 (-),score=83.40 TRINITY_DN581_c0_g1_i2:210-1229(-)
MTVTSDAEALFHSIISGAGELIVDGMCTLNNTIEEAEEDAEILAGLIIRTGGRVIVTGHNHIKGLVQLAGSLEVDANANVTFAGDVAVESGSSFQIKGQGMLDSTASLVLGSSSSLVISGSLDLGCDVSGNGTIQYSSQGQSDSIISAGTIGAHLSIRDSSKVKITGPGLYLGVSLDGSSTLSIESTSNCSGDIQVAGSSTLSVGTSGSLHVSGSASFSGDTTYSVSATSTDSTNYITVEGEATLGGHLVIDTSIQFDANTKLTIMKYGSRASASTFTSVTVNSNKRNFSQNDEDYEVVYEDDQAYIQQSSSSGNESSQEDISSSIIMSCILLCLTVLF